MRRERRALWLDALRSHLLQQRGAWSATPHAPGDHSDLDLDLVSDTLRQAISFGFESTAEQVAFAELVLVFGVRLGDPAVLAVLDAPTGPPQKFDALIARWTPPPAGDAGG